MEDIKNSMSTIEDGKSVRDNLVFVYGTLKSNEPNYDQMINISNGRAIYVGLGKTVQKWPLVIASRYNIPYLLWNEGVGKNIIGEVFSVDEKMLSHMDQFEGHPTYYERMRLQVELQLPHKSTITPWAYFLKNFRPQLLELPFLENYSSKDPHGLPYITRYCRTEGENYFSDVKNSV